MKNYKQKTLEKGERKSAFNPAPVSEYMVPTRKLITFQPDTEIMDVVDQLLLHKITGAPVLDSKGSLVGLIDDKDCLRILFDVAYHNQPIKNTKVSHYTTNVMKTISANSNILDVADTFLNSKYKRLLIVDDEDKLVGQISRQDILQAIHDFHNR